VLRRIAARGVFALARVGARFSSGSGDYAIALSTAIHNAIVEPSEVELNLLFEATMDAVEDAVLDALLSAQTKHSTNQRSAYALPKSAVPSARTHE
jgi:D-aminopeptidase